MCQGAVAVDTNSSSGGDSCDACCTGVCVVSAVVAVYSTDAPRPLSSFSSSTAGVAKGEKSPREQTIS